jgi:hypothetical protein
VPAPCPYKGEHINQSALSVIVQLRVPPAELEIWKNWLDGMLPPAVAENTMDEVEKEMQNTLSLGMRIGKWRVGISGQVKIPIFFKPYRS